MTSGCIVWQFPLVLLWPCVNKKFFNLMVIYLYRMSAAAGRPPFLSPEAVCKLVSRYFRVRNVVEDSVKVFPAYDDVNYYLRGELLDHYCTEFVLKVVNPVHTSLPVLKSISKLMSYISSRGFKFSTPCPQLSSAGTDILSLTTKELKGLPASPKDLIAGSVENPENMEYNVLLLSFIPGELLDNIEKKYLTPAVLKEVGEMIATIDKELKVNVFSLHSW